MRSCNDCRSFDRNHDHRSYGFCQKSKGPFGAVTVHKDHFCTSHEYGLSVILSKAKKILGKLWKRI